MLEDIEMIPCPNKLCPNYGKKCWDHCNHCGDDILWRPKGMDRDVKYTGPKPLNPIDGSKHECMKGGTKDGRWYKTDPVAIERQFKYPRVKASVIICSDPDCNTPIVERTEPLLQQLSLHLEKYHNLILFEDFTNILQFKIDHLRNGRFAYTDPFLHIPWEDITKNSIKG